MRKIKVKSQGSGVVKTRKFTDKSIESYCNLLSSASWNGVLNDTNPASAFNNFFETINEAWDVAFPEIEVTQKQQKIYHSPWMSQGLMCSQKK